MALEGVARKVSISFVGPIAIGWILFVIGFGLSTLGNGFVATGSSFYPGWTVSLAGVPLIALALCHIIITNGKAPAILGCIHFFFFMVFNYSIGMILYSNGVALLSSGGRILLHPINLMFSGALISAIFSTAVLMTIPFWTKKGEDEEKA